MARVVAILVRYEGSREAKTPILPSLSGADLHLTPKWSGLWSPENACSQAEGISVSLAAFSGWVRSAPETRVKWGFCFT
jgi:hypothetical protein